MIVKWGIIGCGDVTEVKSGPALNKVKNSSLVAVMRRDPDLAKDYAKRHNVQAWYSDAEDLIYDKDVNAIYVATPPSTHATYAMRAMKAGKPVYVEKPMALNYQECMDMIAVSEQTGVPLFVAYYRRALPGFLKVKELIEAGKIGAVRSIKLELFKSPDDKERSGEPGWRVDPAVAGAGHFFDLGSHQLDFLDFLFGPIVTITSSVKNKASLYEAEDFVDAEFIFQNGIECKAMWDFSGFSGIDKDLIEISGDQGKISFSTFNFVPVTLHSQGADQYFDFPKPDHVQLYLMQDVVMEILGHGKSASTGISASRTSWVMDHVVKEYYNS